MTHPESLLHGYRLQAMALTDAAAVGRLQADTWQAIDAALRSVIGPLGVAALLARSLHVAARTHACLGAACPASGAAPDVALLCSTLAAQPLDTAQAAGLGLLQVHEDLLNSLIGAALAARLLRPVGLAPAGAAPHEDPQP